MVVITNRPVLVHATIWALLSARPSAALKLRNTRVEVVELSAIAATTGHSISRARAAAFILLVNDTLLIVLSAYS